MYKLKAYVPVPFLAKQFNSFSDILNQDINYDGYFNEVDKLLTTIVRKHNLGLLKY